MKRLGTTESIRWRISSEPADLSRVTPVPRIVALPAEAKSLRVDLSRTACIVIDIQNDFCAPEGSLAGIGVDVGPARRPIEPLARLLPELRRATVPVVWVSWGNRPDRLNLSPSLLHVYDPAGEGCGLGSALPGNGSRVLEKGSWGAELVEPLKALPGDIRVDKYRMSGFWDTPLDSILRNLGATTLLFGGVNVDQCAMITLQDANFLGYNCILLSDCSGTTSPSYCLDATLYNVQQCFGFVASGAAVIDAMGDAA